VTAKVLFRSVGVRCFVSYASDDGEDAYFRTFLDDLEHALAKMVARPELVVDSRIGAGLPWERVLGSALATADVFVPFVSVSYLSPRGEDCYCGKEFDTFASRSDPSAPTHIVPVLWSALDDVTNMEIPRVNALEFNLDQRFADPARQRTYREYGLALCKMAAKYKDTAKVAPAAIARRIADVHRQGPPLGPLTTPPPTFGTMSCAFHADCRAAMTPLTEEVAVAGPEGPDHIVVNVSASPERQAPLRVLLEKTTRGLDLALGTASARTEETIALLDLASRQKKLCVLAIDESSDLRADAITEIASSSQWKGALLLVGDGVPRPTGLAPGIDLLTVPDLSPASAAELSRRIEQLRTERTRALDAVPIAGPGPVEVPRL
jgi:hypothetical protein